MWTSTSKEPVQRSPSVRRTVVEFSGYIRANASWIANYGNAIAKLGHRGPA
jgi:hypothetical protein